MKLSIAIITIFAVSCVLAAPTNLKSFKSLSQARMNGRLQSGHKTVQTKLAHPSKNVHHVALKRNQIRPDHASKHNSLTAKHSQTAYKITKEQPVALLAKDSFFLSAPSAVVGAALGGNYLNGETEKLTILYLESGKVAIRTPQGAFLRMISGGEGAKVQIAAQIDDWSTYELLTHSDGLVSFKSAHGNYLRAEKVGGAPQIDGQTYVGGCEKFTIVDPSKKAREQTVGFKAKDGSFVSVRSGATGAVLGGNSQIGETEKLTILYLEAGKVAIRTPQGAYLRTHSGGDGAQVDVVPQIGESERYELINQPDGTVSFKTAHGTYLKAEIQRGVLKVMAQTYVGGCEKFNLVDPFHVTKEQAGALKTFHGTFVSVQTGETGSTVSQKAQIGATEKLTLLTLESGKVAIRTPQGAYLSTHSTEALAIIDCQAKIDDSATFELVQNPDGTVSFKSFQGTYLRAEEGGEGAEINTQEFLKDWERFTLVGQDGASAPAK